MTAHSKIIEGKTTVFRLNRSQAIRIPKDFAFPDDVRELVVRRSGDKLIIGPKREKPSWDEFFDRPPCPDFPDRASQGDYEERESF